LSSRQNESEDILWRTLSRAAPIDVLGCTIESLHHKEGSFSSDLQCAAVIFDTNVLLRLPEHNSAANIIDYLAVKHKGPISIPGQAIQEVWNNHLGFDLKSRDKLVGKFRQFRDALSGSDVDRAFLNELSSKLDEFEHEQSHMLREDYTDRLVSALERLRSRAGVVFVNRERFAPLAKARHLTKTPPGFKDDRNCDFFIWADGLLGVLLALGERQSLSCVLMITGDKKVDWSSTGKPHPVLSAEVKSLFDVPLYIVDLDGLAGIVERFGDSS
jgi:hypothetical protein